MLSIRDLHLTMRSFEGRAHVLNGINLDIGKGEIWGLVGETGSGKSLTGLSINRLTPPAISRVEKGEVLFHGEDLIHKTEAEMRAIRGRRIAMVFQDPTTNLNPTFRIATQMVDIALAASRNDPSVLGLTAGASMQAYRRAARERAVALLHRVGIRDADRRIDDYPHQFSGGMRQRVLIAMALIGKPELLIADEPTTALDVSSQAQILDLLFELVQENDLSVLFITHNLGVVARLCSHTAVLYGGTVVEDGLTRDVLSSPRHPYTRGLIASIPHLTGERTRLSTIAGNVESFWEPLRACPFAARCAHAAPACREAKPVLRPMGTGAGHPHRAACIRAEEIPPC